MRFVATQYLNNFENSTLRRTNLDFISNSPPEDVYAIEALLILAVVFHARLEEEASVEAWQRAVDLALKLQTYRSSFCQEHSNESAIVEESLRRTWWMLFVSDTILASTSPLQKPSRLNRIESDVPLPCEEAEFQTCCSNVANRTRSEFGSRKFCLDDYKYSSFAYLNEAAKLVHDVQSLGANYTETSAVVHTVKADIANFFMSLPAEKREVVEGADNHQVDEILFLVHTVANAASISFHRPRSNLVYVRQCYHTACQSTSRASTTLDLPLQANAGRTARVHSAAKGLSALMGVQTQANCHSTFFICAIAMATIVHLPAYLVTKSLEAARELNSRLTMSISTLDNIAEVWPIARAMKNQISSFAREMMFMDKPEDLLPMSPLQEMLSDVEAENDDTSWVEQMQELTQNTDLELDSPLT